MAPYTVRRSKRARRVRVTVHPDGSVEVVLPQRAPAKAAAEAVVELGGWIERRRRAALRAAAEVARPEGVVGYLGEELMLVPEPGRTRAHRRGDRLLARAAPVFERDERHGGLREVTALLAA